MTAIIENIENNCFGTNLRKTLFELKVSHSDKPEIEVFINLCNQTLKNNIKIEEDELLDNFSSIERIKNIELRARWREYLYIRFPKEKKEHLKEAVSNYLEVFALTKEPKYLIHSLRLVKTAKALFKGDFERIYEIGKKELIELDKPFLQKEIIVELFSINPEKTKVEFGDFLKEEIIKLTAKNDYSGVFFLIESLMGIKVITKIEGKIMHAENYEKEGDHQTEDKKPNTYYPTILITYQKGLREIKNIPCDDYLRRRLENKVLQEQKEQIKMHTVLSRVYLDKNKIFDKVINNFGDSFIERYKIYDFQSGFRGLISFPISLGDKININPVGNYPFSELFDTFVRIDSKGKAVGKTNSENFYKIENRRIYRECIINFLIKAKGWMDEDKILNKEIVFYHIFEKCNSRFMPAERKWLFAQGIYAGFKNEFTTSAHILVPQLENSFKFILEKKGALTAKIYDEIQHDNMLGGLLDNLIKVNGHDIFHELKDFLLENNSVNFRNELCHGLLSPAIIKHYGIYVWWLTIKLIIDKEKIFDN